MILVGADCVLAGDTFVEGRGLEERNIAARRLDDSFLEAAHRIQVRKNSQACLNQEVPAYLTFFAGH
jgi:hypothetical protein